MDKEFHIETSDYKMYKQIGVHSYNLPGGTFNITKHIVFKPTGREEKYLMSYN